MRVAGSFILLSLVAGLMGCSQDDGSNAAAPTEPEPVTVTVVLVDRVPLEVLQNGGGRECTSVNIIDEAFGGEPTPPVEVTLRDAAGAIVGTETLSERGGSFSKASGCEWEVSFVVAASDFYEASVMSKAGENKGTAETEGSEATVSITL